MSKKSEKSNNSTTITNTEIIKKTRSKQPPRTAALPTKPSAFSIKTLKYSSAKTKGKKIPESIKKNLNERDKKIIDISKLEESIAAPNTNTIKSIIPINSKSSSIKKPKLQKILKTESISELPTLSNNDIELEELLSNPEDNNVPIGVMNNIDRIAFSNKKKILKIASLGGVGEIGKNLYVYEYAGDMFIIDCGLAFPDDEMLGIDIVIPDFTYLEKNASRFRGIVLTHGHEDHIGALPFLLKKIKVPVYGTKLTLGLLEFKLAEHKLLNNTTLNVVKAGEKVKLGCMDVEFIRVNHSIPDACAIAVHTPVGVAIHMGDFKVDYTPIEGEIIDLGRFAELGNKGVLALLSESTNVERRGYTMTESKVGDSFRRLFETADTRRIIVATFATNIHRIQQVINVAAECGRKIAVSGRSMENFIEKAKQLGYLNFPSELFLKIDAVSNNPPNETVILTTGSQGETLSALTRMSACNHRQVEINANDLVIISATPIPGNEKTVSKVVNDLMRLGAEVIYESMYEVHVSGHACQEELKLILALTKPKFFIPIHGELKHLHKHANLAYKMGIKEENIFIISLGKQIETDGVSMRAVNDIPYGRDYVDGFSAGEVGPIVLRDRQKLGQDGIMVVYATVSRRSGKILAGPDIFSRGFIYLRESEDIISEIKSLLKKTLKCCLEKNTNMSNTKESMQNELGDFLFAKFKRTPAIFCVVMETSES